MARVKLTKKFLKKHNLTINHFSKMISMSRATIYRYRDKKGILNINKQKIETAIDIINELDLVYPDLGYKNTPEGITAYKKASKEAAALDKKFMAKYSKVNFD